MLLVNLFCYSNLHKNNYIAAEIQIKSLGPCTHKLTLSIKVIHKSHPGKHWSERLFCLQLNLYSKCSGKKFVLKNSSYVL